MIKDGLFKKYFLVCSMCVIVSILTLGAILTLFVSRYFEAEKYDLLERNARSAASITSDSYTGSDDGSGIINKRTITIAYGLLSSAIDAEFFLTDVSGTMVYGVHMREPIPEDIVKSALDSGMYTSTSTVGGVFESPQYVVALPVIAEDTTIGVLFAATSAASMNEFLGGLMEMFLISAVAVLVVAFILIYFITAKLAKPLKDMASATLSFAQGDFSVRVPNEGHDEVALLANAFNNMASSLAMNESSRRSFVANVSHELRTPMTTISGFVDGILDGTIPPEKHNEYLGTVSSEVKRLSRLVRSMLDQSRIEAGELKMNPTVFDISEVYRQSIFAFETKIEEKELNLEGIEEDRVMVTADKDLMHQVIYNLIENAVKFVNEKGTLSVQYKTENKRVYMTIRNTGQGIAKEEVTKLFERFYKSDKSRSLNKNGVGLGLNIVKSIVNYHGGEIVVRSVEGEYAEFEFSVLAAMKS